MCPQFAKHKSSASNGTRLYFQRGTFTYQHLFAGIWEYYYITTSVVGLIVLYEFNAKLVEGTHKHSPPPVSLAYGLDMAGFPCVP